MSKKSIGYSFSPNRAEKTLHNRIINFILGLKPLVKEVDNNTLVDAQYYQHEYEGIDLVNKTLNILFTNEPIHYRGYKFDFNAFCLAEFDKVCYKFANKKSKSTDPYGSVLIGSELLYNNYYIECSQQENNPKGFVNVFSFATMNKNGVFRFSQIVYSFFFKRLVLRTDICYQLPNIFKLDEVVSHKRRLTKSEYDNVLRLIVEEDQYNALPKNCRDKLHVKDHAYTYFYLKVKV
jgi:hypothetical protein